MMQHQLGVHELLAEDRQLAAVEAPFPAKRGRGGVSARQGVGQQCVHPARAVGEGHRVVGAGSAPLAAAARAQLEDLVGQASPCRHFRRVGALPTARAVDCLDGGPRQFQLSIGLAKRRNR